MEPRAPTLEDLVRTLALSPHPEGGFFRETYRSAEQLAALPARFGGPRSVSTAIYYLLGAGDMSALHRIHSDEVWHFYLGRPLEVVVLAADGTARTIVLGVDLAAGQVPQAVVEAGAWFGARLHQPVPGAFALVGCTVAPGFDFADLELAERAALLARYPQHAGVIAALTRG